MKLIGWVLAFDDGRMFHMTEHHRFLSKTNNIQYAMILRTEEEAERVKGIYTSFLANTKPKGLYIEK